MSIAIKPDLDLLMRQFQLQQLQQDRFRGINQDITGVGHVFGGQVLAQAVIAVSSTEKNKRINSLHGYFLRPGQPEKPIDYIVAGIRGGNSFSTYRLEAIQEGHAIFTMLASFHSLEAGVEHQIEKPSVAMPEDILKAQLNSENHRLIWSDLEKIDRFSPFEFCRVHAYNPNNPEKQSPEQQIWFRLTGKPLNDPVIRSALLAFASDTQLIRTAALPHGVSWARGKMTLASLDHAMWFHKEPLLHGWCLYVCDSPASGAGRGIARGIIFDQSGTLLATIAQEGVLRIQRNTKMPGMP